MKIFVSWSGPKSQIIAEAFQDFLPVSLMVVKPFISTRVRAGSQWFETLMKELEETKFGILCITPENKDSIWIHFEAGALAKTIHHGARIVPVLFDLNPSDLVYPLAQFQAIRTTKGDIKKLIADINATLKEEGEPSLTDKQIDEAGDIFWSKFENSLINIEPDQASTVAEPLREERELLEELLILVRNYFGGKDVATKEQTSLPIMRFLPQGIIYTSPYLQSIIQTLYFELHDTVMESTDELDIATYQAFEQRFSNIISKYIKEKDEEFLKKLPSIRDDEPT